MKAKLFQLSKIIGRTLGIRFQRCTSKDYLKSWNFRKIVLKWFTGLKSFILQPLSLQLTVSLTQWLLDAGFEITWSSLFQDDSFNYIFKLNKQLVMFYILMYTYLSTGLKPGPHRQCFLNLANSFSFSFNKASWVIKILTNARKNLEKIVLNIS